MTTSYKRITESVEDLLAKSHYMVAKCRVDGNLTFDSHHKTVEETDNESRCRSLCLRIERALESCREEEITELLEIYDLLHRIGYGKQPDQRFITEQRQRVYTAWRSGNRNIQESQIYTLLKKSVNGRPIANNMLKNWLRSLTAHNHFPNVTSYENYQRLTLIMREKIDRLIDDSSKMLEMSYGKNGKELKREWYEANRVEDLSTLSTSLLKSYRSFINSLFPSVLNYESWQELDAEILSELIARDDISNWDKRAYRMQFEQIPVII
ncbi:MAG: hypothetical protein K2J78_01870 [Muribaculaceae bacterium]|nr:hypothetical protein [Muribaculaceae bacterium]